MRPKINIVSGFSIVWNVGGEAKATPSLSRGFIKGLQRIIFKKEDIVLVNYVVVARLAKFFFKPGEREEGFDNLDLVLNKEVRNLKGYRGYVSMFSCDQDNVAVILTMWEDDESFGGSQELFSSTMEKVKVSFEREPEVEHYRIDTVDLAK